MKRYTLAVVTALLVCMPWHETVRATPPSYTVENLGNFGGLVPAIAGVNASGQVVGNVLTDAGSQAVRYTNGLGWQALPGLDSSVSSVATGINAAGDVVGYLTSAGVAFRSRDGLPLEQIAPLSGGSFIAGFAINAGGTIVGYADSPAGVVGFRADPGLPAVALPSLNGGFAVACGINTAGQVAGYSLIGDGMTVHGTRIDPGATSAVEILPLDGPAGTAQVCAIDSDGTVGGVGTNAGAAHAFRFSDATGGLDLDTFAGSTGSTVNAIAGGLSVGQFQLDDFTTTHAFAHRNADGSFDLNARIDDPAWVLSAAKGVNAGGVIVGDGLFNGAAAAFRLTPVVPDTTAPVISLVSANPFLISPADGRVVPVTVTVAVRDNVDPSPACIVTGVTGGAAGDASVTGPLSVQVRAVGNAAYTVSVRCTDASGNFSNAATGVTVVAPPPPPPTDTKPPVIRFLFAQRTEIKLNGMKWESVRLFVRATDNVDHSPFCSITSITGAPAAAYSITGRLTARLRENRAAGDLDRVYKLNVTCVDDDGNAAQAWVGIDPNGRTTYSGDHRRWRW